MRCTTRAVLVVLPFLSGCAAREPSATAVALLEKPRTGFVDVEGGKVWYEIEGTGTGTPLLVLHGGPGIPHDYLSNLALLGNDRPVVFYDQLGCGRSERPDDPSLWTRERFARELGQVRAALGLDEVVLYGHSWGSILAVDYLTGRSGAVPTGVKGAILAGPALDIPRWSRDSRRLLGALTPEQVETIREGERTGAVDTEAFHAATDAYYHLYVCRCDPWPDEVGAAFAGMGAEVYTTMNGPTEFTITGPLKSLDVTPLLKELALPLLFVCGEYDEATPESTRAYAAMAKHADVEVIEGAAHLANYDRPEVYMATLRRWLRAERL